MPNYRRAWMPGGTFFFTHVLVERGSGLLVRHADALRNAVALVRRRHPFDIHAFVVLPDHLHAVLQFPEADADFATRWRLIKARFSRAVPVVANLPQRAPRAVNAESGNGATGSTTSATSTSSPSTSTTATSTL